MKTTTTNQYTHISIAPIPAPIGEVLDAGSDYNKQTEIDMRLALSAPEMLALLEKLTFVAETVANLRGLEREILPTTDAARALIAQIKGGKHE